MYAILHYYPYGLVGYSQASHLRAIHPAVMMVCSSWRSVVIDVNPNSVFFSPPRHFLDDPTRFAMCRHIRIFLLYCAMYASVSVLARFLRVPWNENTPLQSSSELRREFKLVLSTSYTRSMIPSAQERSNAPCSPNRGAEQVQAPVVVVYLILSW